MNHRIKTFFIIAVIMVITGSSYLILDRLREGFSLAQIRSTLDESMYYPSPSLNEEEKAYMQTLFAQPFYYLGKGCQFYAFTSEDGKYVLKFFKHKHLRSLSWLKKLPLTSSLQETCRKKIDVREQKIHTLLSSCHFAANYLPLETGILSAHLNRSSFLHAKVCLIDKIGFRQEISLDDHEWILQKKMEPAKTALLQLVEQKNEEALRRCIQALSVLVIRRCERGIFDADRAFIQNVAFDLETGEARMIDIGQLSKDEKLKNKSQARYELECRLAGMKGWAEEKCPALLPYVEEEMVRCLSNASD